MVSTANAHTARIRRRLRIPLAVAITTAAVANILVVISMATDHWERIEYDSDALRRVADVIAGESTFDDVNGFYIVTMNDVIVRHDVVTTDSGKKNNNSNHDNTNAHRNGSSNNSAWNNNSSGHNNNNGNDNNSSECTTSYSGLGSIINDSGANTASQTNRTKRFYLRSLNGGIWRLCNRITGWYQKTITYCNNSVV